MKNHVLQGREAGKDREGEDQALGIEQRRREMRRQVTIFSGTIRCTAPAIHIRHASQIR
jgi:hypothetical protein